jgi:hypothetical protein
MTTHSFWRAALLTLAATLGFAPAGAAQDPSPAGIGSRIRLTLQGSPAPQVIGRLVELGTDSLTLEGKKAEDRRVLLRSSISQVEVSLRRESQIGRGIGLGALGGALVGAVTAFVISAATPACEEAGVGNWEWCNKISTGKMLGILALGAAAGAAFGYQQAVEHPRDVWAPARWIDEERPARGWSRAQPQLGFSTVGGRPGLLLGLSLTR